MPVVPFGGILATVVFFVLCRLPWAASFLSAFPFFISFRHFLLGIRHAWRIGNAASAVFSTSLLQKCGRICLIC
jgi:hypothetical protein